ncbi:D-sedoheptulose 7-phosphate isomerase [Fusobacterium ulcerans]|uniref:D-sedoheptulose-7-phosphate isomerase n=1 Tax=Fusobacterium ulcerans TaxID=861 RepID=UPI0034B036FC
MKKSTNLLIENLIIRFPKLSNCKQEIEDSILEIVNCYKNNGKLLICGNGGSASDSLHMVGELMKSFVLPRKLENKYVDKIKNIFPQEAEYFISNLQSSLPAIALVSEISLITAYSNDNNSELVFAQQVLGYGNEGDILIAISTSGNSKNVIYASQISKIKGMKVISLTGKFGGKLKNISDININVEEEETYIIQEYHLPIYHSMCLGVENEMFGEE